MGLFNLKKIIYPIFLKFCNFSLVSFQNSRILEFRPEKFLNFRFSTILEFKYKNFKIFKLKELTYNFFKFEIFRRIEIQKSRITEISNFRNFGF